MAGRQAAIRGRYIMLASILALAFAAQVAVHPVAPIPTTEWVAPPTSPALLPGTVQFDMVSKITGRSYRIYVSKPQDPTPPGGFPVLYVLDGDAFFS